MNAEAFREVERRSNHILRQLKEMSSIDVVVDEFYEFLDYNSMGSLSDIGGDARNAIGAVVTHWLVINSIPFVYYRQVIDAVMGREVIAPPEQVAEEVQVKESDNDRKPRNQ